MSAGEAATAASCQPVRVSTTSPLHVHVPLYLYPPVKRVIDTHRKRKRPGECRETYDPVEGWRHSDQGNVGTVPTEVDPSHRWAVLLSKTFPSPLIGTADRPVTLLQVMGMVIEYLQPYIPIETWEQFLENQSGEGDGVLVHLFHALSEQWMAVELHGMQEGTRITFNGLSLLLLRPIMNAKWRPAPGLDSHLRTAVHQLVLMPLLSALPACGPCRTGPFSSPPSDNTMLAKRIPSDDSWQWTQFYDIPEVSQVLRQSVDTSDDSLSRLQTGAVLSQLRPYQQETVLWALQQEQGQHISWEDILWYNTVVAKDRGCIDSSFGEDDTITLYYTPLLGGALRVAPPHIPFPRARGGILADEMGLGKTVELITVIHSHRADLEHLNSGTTATTTTTTTTTTSNTVVIDGKEGERGIKEELLPAGGPRDAGTVEAGPQPTPVPTTLIVCPRQLLEQWRSEFDKHLMHGSQKVLIYPGHSGRLSESHPEITAKYGHELTAADIAHFDIVLTTYSVMRREMNHVRASESNYTFRHKRQHEVTPSILPSLHWWRICLDEAQNVGREQVTDVLQLAWRLSSHIRWCVTGTPIQWSCSDLIGLFRFLGLPCDDAAREITARRWPHMLLQTLSQFMRRTRKADVQEQLAIPRQYFLPPNILTLSPVEQHHYFTQVERVQRALHGRRIVDVEYLLNLCLRLRQACCHHQLGAGAVKKLQKKAMTVGELVTELIHKAREEAEDSLREIISCYNGLAAIQGSLGNKATELELFKGALAEIKAGDDRDPPLGVDKLLRFHIYTYISRLGLESDIESERAQGQEWAEEAQKVRTQIVSGVGERRARAMQQLREAMQGVHDLKPKPAYEPWWSRWIRSLTEREQHIVLADVRQTITGSGFDPDTGIGIIDSVRDITGLLYTLEREVAILGNLREEVLADLAALGGAPNEDRITRFSNCRLCNNVLGRVGDPCQHCELLPKLELYNTKLSGYASTVHQSEAALESPTRATVVAGQGTAGVTKPNSRKRKLASGQTQLLSLLRRIQKMIPQRLPIAHEALDHLESFDKYTKELRAMWTSYRQQKEELNTLDDLVQSLERISVWQPGDRPITIHEEQFKLKITIADVPEEIERLNAKKVNALYNLQEQDSKIAYFAQMRDITQPDGSEARCPICYDTMSDEVAMFPCAHRFCKDCIQGMIKSPMYRNRSTFGCPVCRTRYKIHRDISYVRKSVQQATGGGGQEHTEGQGQGGDVDTSNTGHPEIRVKGSWGTKVEAIVESLLHLHQHTPEAKSLVFSTWHDILYVIREALNANHLPCVHLNGKTRKGFGEVIRTFHSSDTPVMLLRFRDGADGLNLTEATHIFLVEPSLNPGEVRQAVSRVHRIGQSKETFVHSYVVQGTVEQAIFARTRDLHLQGASHGMAVLRKEKTGLFTAQDLMNLMTPDQSALKQGEGGTQTSGVADLFWQQKVLYRGRHLVAQDLLAILESSLAATRRQQSQVRFQGGASSHDMATVLTSIDGEVDANDNKPGSGVCRVRLPQDQPASQGLSVGIRDSLSLRFLGRSVSLGALRTLLPLIPLDSLPPNVIDVINSTKTHLAALDEWEENDSATAPNKV